MAKKKITRQPRRVTPKADVIALMKKFDLEPNPKPGELVVTAEIHRVIGPFECRNPNEKAVEVVTVWPNDCGPCNKDRRECVHSHIAQLRGGGQQGVMSLKSEGVASYGDTVFLMKGWDRRTFHAFIPSPGIFLTEEEAKEYCRRNPDPMIDLTYERLMIGRMETKDD